MHAARLLEDDDILPVRSGAPRRARSRRPPSSRCGPQSARVSRTALPARNSISTAASPRTRSPRAPEPAEDQAHERQAHRQDDGHDAAHREEVVVPHAHLVEVEAPEHEARVRSAAGTRVSSAARRAPRRRPPARGRAASRTIPGAGRPGRPWLASRWEPEPIERPPARRPPLAGSGCRRCRRRAGRRPRSCLAGPLRELGLVSIWPVAVRRRSAARVRPRVCAIEAVRSGPRREQRPGEVGVAGRARGHLPPGRREAPVPARGSRASGVRNRTLTNAISSNTSAAPRASHDSGSRCQ